MLWSGSAALAVHNHSMAYPVVRSKLTVNARLELHSRPAVLYTIVLIISLLVAFIVAFIVVLGYNNAQR